MRTRQTMTGRFPWLLLLLAVAPVLLLVVVVVVPSFCSSTVAAAAAEVAAVTTTRKAESDGSSNNASGMDSNSLNEWSRSLARLFRFQSSHSASSSETSSSSTVIEWEKVTNQNQNQNQNHSPGQDVVMTTTAAQGATTTVDISQQPGTSAPGSNAVAVSTTTATTAGTSTPLSTTPPTSVTSYKTGGYYNSHGGPDGTFLVQDGVLQFIRSSNNNNNNNNSGGGQGSSAPASSPTQSMHSSGTALSYSNTTYSASSPGNSSWINPDRPGNDDDYVFDPLDCARFEGWENPPPECQIVNQSNITNGTDGITGSLPPVGAPTTTSTHSNNNAMDDDATPDQNKDKDKHKHNHHGSSSSSSSSSSNGPENVIAIRLSLAMSQEPTTLEPLNRVVSQVVTHVLDNMTPFHAVYFGYALSTPPWPPAQQRRFLANGNASGFADAAAAAAQDQDDGPSNTNRAPIDLLHVYTVIHDPTVTPQSGSFAARPGIYWYDTSLHFGAFFRSPNVFGSGSTTGSSHQKQDPDHDNQNPQPIWKWDQIGNITYICQSALNRTITNGVLIALLGEVVEYAIEQEDVAGPGTSSAWTGTQFEDKNATEPPAGSNTENLSDQLALVGVATMGVEGRGPASFATGYTPPEDWYHEPLDLQFGLRERVGLFLFSATLLVATTLYLVAGWIQRRQIQQQAWSAILTEQGITDVLQVGWRYKTQSTVAGTSRAGGGDTAVNGGSSGGGRTSSSSTPQLYLEVYEKSRKRFTNDEDSLLHGGVERDDGFAVPSSSYSQRQTTTGCRGNNRSSSLFPPSPSSSSLAATTRPPLPARTTSTQDFTSSEDHSLPSTTSTNNGTDDGSGHPSKPIQSIGSGRLLKQMSPRTLSSTGMLSGVAPPLPPPEFQNGDEPRPADHVVILHHRRASQP